MPKLWDKETKSTLSVLLCRHVSAGGSNCFKQCELYHTHMFSIVSNNVELKYWSLLKFTMFVYFVLPCWNKMKSKRFLQVLMLEISLQLRQENLLNASGSALKLGISTPENGSCSEDNRNYRNYLKQQETGPVAATLELGHCWDWAVIWSRTGSALRVFKPTVTTRYSDTRLNWIY